MANPLARNPLVQSVRDVVGVESWAAQTMPDGADSDGVENPDRRDGWGDPPATFEDSEPENHDQVGDDPARRIVLDFPEPVTEARPLRSVWQLKSVESTAGGRLLVPRDANRYRLGLKVSGGISAHISQDTNELFDTSGNGNHFLLESGDGILWLHGGYELFARGHGGTCSLYCIEEYFAVGTRVPDAERPSASHE